MSRRHRFRIVTRDNSRLVSLEVLVNGAFSGSITGSRAEALAILDVLRAGAAALESPGPHVRHVDLPEQLEIVVEEAGTR